MCSLTCNACFLKYLACCKKSFLRKKSYQTQTKSGFLTNFLMYVSFVVQFIVWSQMTHIAFYIAHIYPPVGARWLPWLYFEKWTFFYYQHNVDLSTLMLTILCPKRQFIYFSDKSTWLLIHTYNAIKAGVNIPN